jgi:hypothetical protein
MMLMTTPFAKLLEPKNSLLRAVEQGLDKDMVEWFQRN